MNDFKDIKIEKPIEEGKYLCILRGHCEVKVCSLRIINGAFSWKNSLGNLTTKVTHWFKFPEVPEALMLNMLLLKATQEELIESEKDKLCYLLKKS